ncbi:MAG: hypothetical protein HOQ22_01485, partial [Nocardioidaceae bacterium]|nr:hypothetical protein [Nocardioidaceae bacterium]
MTSSAVIAEMIADVEEFLDSVDGLDDLLDDLHALGAGEPPTPTGELAELLGRTPRAERPAVPISRAS